MMLLLGLVISVALNKCSALSVVGVNLFIYLFIYLRVLLGLSY